jgi:hypothetical protein
MKLLKRAAKWTGLALLLVVAVLLIVHSVRLSRSDRRLEEQLAAIREAGEPVQLVDLTAPPIPPEENANTYLRRARQDIESLYEELNPLFVEGKIWEEPAAEEDVAKILSAWEAYPAILPLLDKAAACDRFDAGRDYTVNANAFIEAELSRSSGFRTFIRVLHARAVWQLAEGRRDDALTTAILMLRLTRHFDSRSAILIRHLVGIACRGIALDVAHRPLRDGPVSSSMHDALEAELLSHDMFATFAASLRTERVIGIEKYALIPNRNNWFLRHTWNEDQSTYLDMMSQHLATLGQTFADFQLVESKLQRQLVGRGAPLAQNVLPAVQAAYEATIRTEAQIRCLRLLNKLISLEEAPGPDEVDPVSLGLPKDVFVDPYSGQRLQIKRLPDGWLIYSVGRNLKDDGGTLDPFKDIGFGPGTPSSILDGSAAGSD